MLFGANRCPSAPQGCRYSLSQRACSHVETIARTCSSSATSAFSTRQFSAAQPKPNGPSIAPGLQSTEQWSPGHYPPPAQTVKSQMPPSNNLTFLRSLSIFMIKSSKLIETGSINSANLRQNLCFCNEQSHTPPPIYRIFPLNAIGISMETFPTKVYQIFNTNSRPDIHSIRSTVSCLIRQNPREGKPSQGFYNAIHFFPSLKNQNDYLPGRVLSRITSSGEKVIRRWGCSLLVIRFSTKSAAA
jgi:hypothetical protein